MTLDPALTLTTLGQRMGVLALGGISTLSLLAGAEPGSALLRGGLGLVAFWALGWISSTALHSLAPAPDAQPAERERRDADKDPDTEELGDAGAQGPAAEEQPLVLSQQPPVEDADGEAAGTYQMEAEPPGVDLETTPQGARE